MLDINSHYHVPVRNAKIYKCAQKGVEKMGHSHAILGNGK
jgi:hypothetical protein